MILNNFYFYFYFKYDVLNLHHHKGGEGVGAHALGHRLAAGGRTHTLVGGATGGRHQSTSLALVGARLTHLGARVVEATRHDVGEHAARLGATLHASVGALLATHEHRRRNLVGHRVILGELAKAAVWGLLEGRLGAVGLLTIRGHHEGNALGGHTDHALLGVGKVGRIHLFTLS